MTIQATAALAHAVEEPFSIEKIEIRDVREDEVVVEIKGVGICHTDVAAKDGFYGLPYPSLLGHEGSGVVSSVGAHVTSVKPGDEVLISFASCAECTTCLRGDVAYCENFTQYNYIGSRPDGTTSLFQGDTPVHGNFFGQSSFATHAVVAERFLVKAESDLDISLLGPLGCGIQTGAGAIMRSMACKAGSVLVVIGAGTVGMAAVMGGAIQGCEQIIVVEPLASRREQAMRLGATSAIDPSAGELSAQLQETAGRGVDYIFDTSGLPEVINAAIGAAAQQATVGLVGVPRDLSVALPLNIAGAMQRGLRVMGIVEGDSVPQEFIPELLEYHRQGKFPFDQLITTYPLTDINAAIEAQKRGEATKIILLP